MSSRKAKSPPAKGPITTTMFLKTVRTKDAGKIEDLLEKGANIESKGKNISGSTKGQTSLLMFCETGDLPLVQMLVRRGANKNATDNEQNTPLITAIIKEHYDIAEFLLGFKDLDVGAVGAHGKTAFSLAVSSYKTHPELKPILLKIMDGSNKPMLKTALNDEQLFETPLSHAIAAESASGVFEVSNRMVELGADINHKLKNGTSLFLKFINIPSIDNKVFDFFRLSAELKISEEDMEKIANKKYMKKLKQDRVLLIMPILQQHNGDVAVEMALNLKELWGISSNSSSSKGGQKKQKSNVFTRKNNKK